MELESLVRQGSAFGITNVQLLGTLGVISTLGFIVSTTLLVKSHSRTKRVNTSQKIFYLNIGINSQRYSQDLANRNLGEEEKKRAVALAVFHNCIGLPCHLYHDSGFFTSAPVKEFYFSDDLDYSMGPPGLSVDRSIVASACDWLLANEYVSPFGEGFALTHNGLKLQKELAEATLDFGDGGGFVEGSVLYTAREGYILISEMDRQIKLKKIAEEERRSAEETRVRAKK